MRLRGFDVWKLGNSMCSFMHPPAMKTTKEETNCLLTIFVVFANCKCSFSIVVQTCKSRMILIPACSKDP